MSGAKEGAGSVSWSIKCFSPLEYLVCVSRFEGYSSTETRALDHFKVQCFEKVCTGKGVDWKLFVVFGITGGLYERSKGEICWNSSLIKFIFNEVRIHHFIK